MRIVKGDKMEIREIVDWNNKEEIGFVDQLNTALTPLINKTVLLSGGGSWDTNVCVLKEALLVNFPDGSKCVDVKITDIEPPLFRKHDFEARLGSWRISEIIEDDTTKGHAMKRKRKRMRKYDS